MYADDDQLDKQLRSTMFSLSGTGFFGAIGRSINLGKHIFVLHVYLFSQENPSILNTHSTPLNLNHVKGEA